MAQEASAASPAPRTVLTLCSGKWMYGGEGLRKVPRAMKKVKYYKPVLQGRADGQMESRTERLSLEGRAFQMED